MPGLKTWVAPKKFPAETAETKPDEPGDLSGILARKIFAWKISCAELCRVRMQETTPKEICQVVSWL
jgi:hypothetical protein